MKRLCKIEEVAGALALSPKTVRKWIFERKIASTKVGKAVRIPEEEIDRLMQIGRREAISL